MSMSEINNSVWFLVFDLLIILPILSTIILLPAKYNGPNQPAQYGLIIAKLFSLALSICGVSILGSNGYPGNNLQPFEGATRTSH